MAGIADGAAEVKVLGAELYEWPFRLRLPFRFGVKTVTHGRQAVARVRIGLGGGEAFGYAAESLGAKWFDKDLSLSDEQNLDQLRRSLELAVAAYRDRGAAAPFQLYADTYEALQRTAAGERLNPLVAGFGPALLDRAILDAVCRYAGVSFYDAMRRNLPGIAAHAIVPDLAGFDFARFLDSLHPAATIEARHTVGLVDPITAADQPPGTRVEDGLPETLEEVVATYGHRYFKLKVAGNVAADLERLTRIAGVLDGIRDPYFATLDGNEQYGETAEVVELWRAMDAEPRLARLCRSILFIEQPITRQKALAGPVEELARFRPVIIDESDGEVSAFPAAKALGYTGISAKSCKGFYKATLNLARCRMWNAAEGGERFFLSAEDLTTQAGLSVQQDLAIVNLLGLTHVERNGHHFIDGFGGRAASEAEAFLRRHPDLYARSPGGIRLRIENGRLAIGSLDCPGFSTDVVPDLASLEKMEKARWPQ